MSNAHPLLVSYLTYLILVRNQILETAIVNIKQQQSKEKSLSLHKPWLSPKNNLLRSTA